MQQDAGALSQHIKPQAPPHTAGMPQSTWSLIRSLMELRQLAAAQKLQKLQQAASALVEQQETAELPCGDPPSRSRPQLHTALVDAVVNSMQLLASAAGGGNAKSTSMQQVVTRTSTGSLDAHRGSSTTTSSTTTQQAAWEAVYDVVNVIQ